MAIQSHLKEFIAIVEAGSISAAARDLNLPRASLSRRLQKLETFYGVQLVHRATHNVQLSRAGKELYQRARRIVADLEETERVVGALDAVPHGILRVGMPMGAGIEMALAEPFLRTYPDVELEFVATHTHDDLVSNGIDVALRAGKVEDENLIGRKLISFGNYVYASPRLLLERGTPTLENLSTWPCLLDFDVQGRPTRHWPLWNGSSTPVHGPMRTNNVDAQIQGAVRGLGLTLASERLVRPWVERGELEAVLDELVGYTTPVTLVWPPTEFMDPKVRAFVDLAANTISKMIRYHDASE